MKKRNFFLSLLGIMLCPGSFAEIVMDDPVITDSYIKFVGTNSANNYKYTLDTYEWTKGPQFQLTIEALDTSKPAAITTADLNDENFWEPLFRKYTKQLAGQEMEANDNIKRLYIKNVTLQDNLFYSYEDVHIIGIEANGNYALPNNIFGGITHLETLNSDVKGTLTLGTGVVNPNIAFIVNCASAAETQAWSQYKTENNCTYTVAGTGGGIVIEDPVINMGSYIRFIGVNAANNYKYTLDTYEWADRGPQFELNVEALDSSKPAYISAADLNDENFWEPLFRKYTKQLAGEEMSAANNVKRLFINGVSLLANQFTTYEYLYLIEITAEGDYSLPDGVFNGVSRLQTLACSVVGTLTLGNNVVNPKSNFTVNCSNETGKQVWRQYKNDNGCNYIIGGDDSDTPRITEVHLGIIINGYFTNINLKDNGGTVNIVKGITEADFYNFTAKTSGDVSEVMVDYCICPEGVTPSSEMWRNIGANQSGDGEWEAKDINLDLLDGLKDNSTYRLYFSFRTNDGENGRGTYPSDGSSFRLEFSTGEFTGIAKTVNDQWPTTKKYYTLDGRPATKGQLPKGIYIVGNKKVLVK